MQLFSYTSFGTALFLSTLANFFFMIRQTVRPPICLDTRVCLQSFLLQKPILELNIFFSPQEKPRESEVLYVNNFILPDYNVPFKRMMTVKIPKLTKRTGTLYAHVFLSKVQETPYSGDKWTKLLNDSETVYTLIPMFIYIKPEHDGKYMKKDVKAATHVKTVLPVGMLTEPLYLSQVHMENIRLLKKNQEYLPIFLHNLFKDYMSNAIKVDKNTSHVPILLDYEPLNYARLRMMKEIELTMVEMHSFGFNNKIVDEIKIFFDINPYVLLVLFAVACFHMLFDFMAMKNDVLFWKTQKSMAGLSSRSVILSAFSYIIIVLYLFEKDVMLLLISPVILKAIVEIWKVFKVMPVNWKNLKFKQFYRNSAEVNSEKFDAESMKYLLYVMCPLYAVSAVYLFFYEPQMSWYSIIINCLASGVYVFGFILMLPQLYINYKLKSVAHLPWITLIFKALTTIINDFVVLFFPMPSTHRYACLRDDVIFLIYIYQRWLYPVDKSPPQVDEKGRGRKKRRSCGMKRN